MNRSVNPIDRGGWLSGPAALDTRPILVLVGSGSQQWREYVLRSVSRAFALWLLARHEPTWERPYLAGHTPVDALDLRAALLAVTKLAKRVPIVGVFSYDEVRVWQAAKLAEALGVPTSPPDAVLACRDKRRSRELMALGEVAQARSISVASVEQARIAAGEIGYPVILKPRGLAGSEGVVKVDAPSELADAYAFTSAADFREVPRYASGGVLVEEYLDGPEISVDSVVVDGRIHPVFLARKQLDMPGTFEETGHVVSAVDPLLSRPDVREVIRNAHSALGFTYGASHLEMRLTTTGPKIIEVNARLGGDLIPYLGWLATGIDLPLAAASVAAGMPVDLTPTRRCTAAVQFLYPERDMAIDEVRIDPKQFPDGIWEVLPLAQPGQTLRLPPACFVDGRYAAAIALGHDVDDCQRTLDGLGAAVWPVGREIQSGAGVGQKAVGGPLAVGKDR